MEASEAQLWTNHMLPDIPVEKIKPLAGRLTRLWRDRDGRREPRHDVKDVIIELHRRGYKLGLIANTITETEIPDWIERDGLGLYLKTVILSSIFGKRKPGPEIYLVAARQAGVKPERCVYVGDNLKRDVLGTRLAGYSMAIVLLDPDKIPAEPIPAEQQPDCIIHECSDLLKMFPARS
jgi:putative hydrolase of the HAD superfamily